MGAEPGQQSATTGYHYYTAQNKIGIGYSSYNDGAGTWDGVNHLYTIDYIGVDAQGYGEYNIYRDNNLRLTATYQGAGSCMSEAGLASDLSPSPSYTVNTFDVQPLQYFDQGGVPQYWFDTSQWWIDVPCPGTTGYCMNGVYNSTTYWADNKP